jgi:hypothetical protein
VSFSFAFNIITHSCLRSSYRLKMLRLTLSQRWRRTTTSTSTWNPHFHQSFLTSILKDGGGSYGIKRLALLWRDNFHSRSLIHFWIMMEQIKPFEGQFFGTYLMFFFSIFIHFNAEYMQLWVQMMVREIFSFHVLTGSGGTVWYSKYPFRIREGYL